MLLLFYGGIMNIYWIAALSLLARVSHRAPRPLTRGAPARESREIFRSTREA